MTSALMPLCSRHGAPTLPLVAGIPPGQPRAAMGSGPERHPRAFALAFAMLHEVSNPQRLLADVYNALRAGAKLLLAEPVGHVRAKEFETTLALAQELGFALESRPAIRRSHAVMLLKPNHRYMKYEPV